MMCKKIFILTAAIILLLAIAGCTNTTEERPGEIIEPSAKPAATAAAANEPDEPDEPEAEPDKTTVFENGFVFVYNGADIYMGEYIENVLPALGPESDSFLSESCTSDGMMITYIYGGFEISAYAQTDGERYRIFSIELRDDSVATPEGVYIGQTEAELTVAYGAEYEDIFGFYRYTKNGTALGFNIDGGVITGITYQLLIIS